MMEPGGGPEGIHGDRDKSGEAARRDRDRRQGRALLRQRAGGQARRAPPAPQNDQGGRAEGDREHEIRHGGVHVPRRRARPRRLLEEPLRLVRDRSEERRVGKEWRWRWRAYHRKRNEGEERCRGAVSERTVED